MRPGSVPWNSVHARFSFLSFSGAIWRTPFAFCFAFSFASCQAWAARMLSRRVSGDTSFFLAFFGPLFRWWWRRLFTLVGVLQLLAAGHLKQKNARVTSRDCWSERACGFVTVFVRFLCWCDCGAARLAEAAHSFGRVGELPELHVGRLETM